MSDHGNPGRATDAANNVAQNGIANGLPLLPQHLADLRASGLSDEQILGCGFHSLQSITSIQQALRWKRYDGSLGDCLAFPFRDVDGKPSGYCRLKPDRPRKSSKDGKPIKYENPKGAHNQAFFPPGTLAALQSSSAPLVLTEGEKKSAKADQEGFPCIGLVGVFGWQKKRVRDQDGRATGERQLIDQLAAIAWKGRAVYLCFDSDVAVNGNVRSGENFLAETLTRHGALVKIVRLPPGNIGTDGTAAKVGLDDFLVAHGPAAFHGLLLAAQEPSLNSSLKPLEAHDDPHRLARLFINESGMHQDGLMLRFWREEWHLWDGRAYRPVPDKELRARLTLSAKSEMDRLNLTAQQTWVGSGPPPTVRKVTSRLIADVAHALASETILPAGVEPPAWLHNECPFPAADILACHNGLVNLPALVDGKEHFFLPTPRFFSLNALDFDFDLNAPSPTAWLDFLDRIWPGDVATIAALQEWMGYLLTLDTRQQKILLLVGPKRSGKGTIARVIRGLVGPANVVGPTLSSLGMNFGLWPLLGKSVAMIQDARLSSRSDMAAITERLLSVSGEDALTIDRKNLAPVTAKLSARFMILTNELPKLGDESGALTGRMILLRLTHSWFGREDTELTERILAERPGILLWAIAGWERLHKRGHFVQPATGKEMLTELENLSSPVAAFVRERCKVRPGLTVEKAKLYQAWKRWCEEQGRDRPGDAATFGRNLRAVLPNLGESYPRTDAGRIYVYEGISLA